MNQTGDIPKQCQQNINNERPTEPFTEQRAERRQNDGDDDSPETHMYSLLAATGGISVDFFSSGYLDVSVPPVRLINLWIQLMIV